VKKHIIRLEVDYVDKEMNTFRLPFRWERLQHAQFEDLNNEELARLGGLGLPVVKEDFQICIRRS